MSPEPAEQQDWAPNPAARHGFSPHYLQYIPGTGMLHVLPAGPAPGDGFTWRLQTGPRYVRRFADSTFTSPEEAMDDAARTAARMEPGVFAGLDLAEAQQLYQRFAGARPLRSPAEEDGRPAEIEKLRRELRQHLDILDLDPDADPHTPAAAFAAAADTLGKSAWLAALNDAVSRRGPVAPPPAAAPAAARRSQPPRPGPRHSTRRHLRGVP